MISSSRTRRSSSLHRRSAPVGATEHATRGSLKCDEQASSQWSSTSTSVSTKATSACGHLGETGVARRRRTAVHGKSDVRRPGIVDSGGSLPSSTTIVTAPSFVAPGCASYAGTTTVTSATVNGESRGSRVDGAGVNQATGQLGVAGGWRARWLDRLDDATAGGRESRKRRSGEPAMTMLSWRR